MFGLDDGEFGVSRHNRIIVVSSIPEYEVSSFIGFPRVNESDITRDGRFHDVPPTVELSCFLLITPSLDTELTATRVVLNRNSAILYFRTSTRWGEERGDTSSLCIQPSDECSLRYEFDADVS